MKFYCIKEETCIFKGFHPPMSNFLLEFVYKASKTVISINVPRMMLHDSLNASRYEMWGEM